MFIKEISHKINYPSLFKDPHIIIICSVMAVMAAYFILGIPNMADDGFHYQGFTENLSRGVIDFKSYYGFMGLSIFSVPIFWLTQSNISIIYTSMIFVILSIPLAYLVGKSLYGTKKAGIYALILFLLTPYPYTTLMRGFQEGALVFFILLVIYASLNRRAWAPLAWAIGGIVKPFALALFPLFASNVFLNKKTVIYLMLGLIIGGAYITISYLQVGHLVNNAAINSYAGSFDTGNPPPLVESFTLGWKGFGRVAANLLLAFRKIMISPLVVILGGWMLLFSSKVPYRPRFIWAISINLVLVSLLTFSFSKYILPAAVLLSLSAIPLLERKAWLMMLVFTDSFSVSWPIWDFFGRVYWPQLVIYLLPFWTAIIIYLFYEYFYKKRYLNSHA